MPRIRSTRGRRSQYGPDGSLYVAYEATSPRLGFTTDAMVIARSTDDGQTFQTKELSRVFDDLDCYPFFAGRQTLTDMHFRLNSYPSMSVDPSTGAIAIAWTDDQGAGSCGSERATFSGTTSNQVKLLHAPWASIGSGACHHVTGPADKVFPSVAARNQKIVVTYYTRDYAERNRAGLQLPDESEPDRDHPVPSRTRCAWTTRRGRHDGFGSQTRLSSEGSNPSVQFADGCSSVTTRRWRWTRRRRVRRLDGLPRQAGRHSGEPGRADRQFPP